LQSTNGSFLNGNPIGHSPLTHNDILCFGSVGGICLTLQYPDPAKGEPVKTGVLWMETGLLQGESLLLGRAPTCDVQLPAPVVSWRHACIDNTAQGQVLIDLNSCNGTFVNGIRVEGATPLHRGDVVQIGPFKLVHDATQIRPPDALRGMRLDGIALTRDVGQGKERKRILNDVSLTVQPCEFVALVGSSGAGKTTLVKALNGYTQVKGRVLVNGEELYDHFDLYRTLIGYVPQDSIIHRDLTVVNALRYAAQLRLPPDTSIEEIERRIDAVLAQVQIVGQKEQMIRDLSGGERKRVNLAVELLADPKLFFLDEPTSGLDPGLEKKMMQTLRQLADAGKTVILVTHATANITECDLIAFIAQGRLVYYGPPHDALSFFGLQGGDFGEIYSLLDATSPIQAERQASFWEEAFVQSDYYERYVRNRQRSLVGKGAGTGPERPAPAPAGPRINPLHQFNVLTRRYVDLIIHDRLLLTVLLATMPFIALLLLLISKSNWLVGDSATAVGDFFNGCFARGDTTASYYIVAKSQLLLLMLASSAVLLGLFAAAFEIVKERHIYRRERMVSLRLLPYLLSKVVVLTGFAALQCLLLLLVLSLDLKYPSNGVFLPAPLELYASLVLSTWTAIMLGLLISSVVPNTDPVVYLVLVILFFQLIFAGVFFDIPGLSARLSRFTLTRWTMEASGASVNLDALNATSRWGYRFSEPLEEEVSVSLEHPDYSQNPFTVISRTQAVEIPGLGLTVPISVPEVIPRSLPTVTRSLTETVTLLPEPIVVEAPVNFQISYARTPRHLGRAWFNLGAYGLLCGAATLMVLKRQDVQMKRKGKKLTRVF
jgi:ABC-type multidrug transport system ATPase subunit